MIVIKNIYTSFIVLVIPFFNTVMFKNILKNNVKMQEKNRLNFLFLFSFLILGWNVFHPQTKGDEHTTHIHNFPVLN